MKILEKIHKPVQKVRDLPLEMSVRTMSKVTAERSQEERKDGWLPKVGHGLGKTALYLVLAGAAYQSAKGVGRGIKSEHLRIE